MKDLSNYKNYQNELIFDEFYSYLLIEKQDYKNKDLHSISLKNCIIEKSDFSNTLFANADIDSSNLNECVFSDQSFQNADIISCHFMNCTFVSVSFKGATMTSNTFVNCTFVSCNFNHVTMSDSLFTDCDIESIILRQSSTYLNTYLNCNWNKSQISGNFNYNLLIQSSFRNSNVNLNLLSSNFGFTEKCLHDLKINYEDVYVLQQTELERNELISAAIIELNSNKYSYDKSMVFCIDVILTQLINNIIVRAEEIRFIELVLDHLLKERMIAPISIVQMISSLERFFSKAESNTAVDKSKNSLNYIHNTLLIAYQSFVNTLAETNYDHSVSNQRVIIKITFEKQPEIETCKLLSSFQNEFSMPKDSLCQIKTEHGSFIEWIEAPDNILKCIQLLISIIGLAISIRSYKKKKSNKNTDEDLVTNKNTQDNQQQINSNTLILNIPNSINNQIQHVQTEKDISKTINVFIVNGMTINNNYKGFNNCNIKDIEYHYK